MCSGQSFLGNVSGEGSKWSDEKHQERHLGQAGEDNRYQTSDFCLATDVRSRLDRSTTGGSGRKDCCDQENGKQLEDTCVSGRSADLREKGCSQNETEIAGFTRDGDKKSVVRLDLLAAQEHCL